MQFLFIFLFAVETNGYNSNLLKTTWVQVVFKDSFEVLQR